jgi:hypothetical protein
MDTAPGSLRSESMSSRGSNLAVNMVWLGVSLGRCTRHAFLAYAVNRIAYLPESNASISFLIFTQQIVDWCTHSPAGAPGHCFLPVHQPKVLRVQVYMYIPALLRCLGGYIRHRDSVILFYRC